MRPIRLIDSRSKRRDWRRVAFFSAVILVTYLFAKLGCNNYKQQDVTSKLSNTQLLDSLENLNLLHSNHDLEKILAPESPVIKIDHWLDACQQNDNILSFKSYVEACVRSQKRPLKPSDFVCSARCFAEEPELENSMRYLGGDMTKYTANSIKELCMRQHVPLLVRIFKGKAQWAKCSESRLRASHVWFSVIRALFVITKLVELEDVLFAFDNSDFSRPAMDDPHGLSWNYVLPGVVRFVGDSSHPSLLWPTGPYIRATSYCEFDHDEPDANSIAFGWLKHGGCTPRVVEWSQKKDLVFWRGSPTGVPIDDDHVQFMPRSMFNLQFSNREGYDVAFLKDAIPPYANKKFLSRHLWKEGVSRSSFADYKMIVSLDGHTAAWGLVERLSSGSLLLVHESLRGYREFYYEHVKPFVHYLPISFDFTNLEKIRQYVLTPQGDENAQQIVTRAQELVKTRMRPEDLWCYLFRMLTTLSAKREFEVDDEAFRPFKWQDIDENAIKRYQKGL